MARNIHRPGTSKSVRQDLSHLANQHAAEEQRAAMGNWHPVGQQPILPPIVQPNVPHPSAEAGPPQIVQTQIFYVTQPVPQPQSYVDDRASNTGAILLNALFLPGTGQIAQGRIAAGFAFILLWGFCFALVFVGIGLFLLPIVWIVALVDVCNYRPPRTYGHRRIVANSNKDAVGAFILIISTILVLFLIAAFVFGVVASQN